METSIFVVSDLHLGGREGFRMCEAGGRRRLAELFRWIKDQATESRRAHIVFAGDIVDFLAEEPYEAFTASEEVAAQKLEAILAASDEVWTSLSAAAEKCAVTMMLGNHDVELSLPKPRRRLIERIGRPVEFLYDNEAFTFGQLLVEHGNRYDGWNVVDYDALRQRRSLSSRDEPGGSFPTQPGSELVVRIMNKLKARYPWVDLMKPETAGVIPILAALAGSTWAIAAEATQAAARATWRQRQIGTSGTPTDPRFVAETEAAGVPTPPVDDLAAIFALFERWGSASSPAAPEERWVGEGAVTINEELLFRGLRLWGEKDNRTFQIDRESKSYLRPAQALAKRGRWKVVVFGHTHHAKRIPLESGAMYLNTGTWADLMRIPEVILTGEEPAARAQFADFMVALKTDVKDLRRLVPTFARVDFDGANNLTQKDVYFFDEGGNTSPISTKEILRRLA